jgi:hypothetical protein
VPCVTHFFVCGGRRYSYRCYCYCDTLLGNDSVNTFPRKPTRATIGRLLLDNGSVNTPKTIRDNKGRCFPRGPPRGYITRSSKGARSCCQSSVLSLVPSYAFKVSINPIIQSKTRLISHAQTHLNVTVFYVNYD